MHKIKLQKILNKLHNSHITFIVNCFNISAKKNQDVYLQSIFFVQGSISILSTKRTIESILILNAVFLDQLPKLNILLTFLKSKFCRLKIYILTV